MTTSSSSTDTAPQAPNPLRVPDLRVGLDVYFHTSEVYRHLTDGTGSVTSEQALATPLAAKVAKVINAETGSVNLAVLNADGYWERVENVAMGGAGELVDRTWRIP
ncbi:MULTISPECIES: hypothetical protein [unclassified Corallococcus]|uniref:hypothetical protein n=1 Tax=unclassified Corallococcus TaxID=2685029 RepID=UPI001A8C6197|nr:MULTISPECIES: hypothetical protein [unclassified Corallococcus]MBN9687158.1 hypothetical protein [Corallococcus sp. NCSPR001]WAS89015.1 hypothetical protein O0N60_19030 [Corallococcus sp. NCRR]